MGGEAWRGGLYSLTERSEVVNLDRLRHQANDVLINLSLSLSAIMEGKAINHQDPDELYHQLNDLLGEIVNLGSDDSPLVLLLEEEF